MDGAPFRCLQPRTTTEPCFNSIAYLCYRSMDGTHLLCHNQEQLRTVVSMDGDNNLLYAQKIKSHLVKRIFPICKNLLRKMRDHEKICMVGISQNP